MSPPARRIRTYAEVATPDHEVVDQVLAQRRRLARRLAGIDRIVAVASGKGGVGKSAVTANLAAALATEGLRVGALDADLNGPSLARMLDVVGARMEDGPEGARPPRGAGGVAVVSMDFLQSSPDAPLRWREPEEGRLAWQSLLEGGVLRELLSDVDWGRLDVLLVDVPPGVDKITRLLDLVPDLDGTLLVTTPSAVAQAVVARSVRLVREAAVPVVGLVANMTHAVCPECGAEHALHDGDAPERMAEEWALELWARIPFDRALGSATDAGRPPASGAFRDLARLLVERVPPAHRSAGSVP